jgi:hypothetical protein
MQSTTNCVILVVSLGPLTPKCEEGLRDLERRGYPVRRGRGFSAIDQGRNQMASEALHDGFEETMWIDPDIAFTPEDVERLRAHHLPLVAGLYPQPASRSLACHLLPGTDELVFGAGGGLVEVKSVACGFLYVRRTAYESIKGKLNLPLCNTRFGRGSWPFFQPTAVPEIDVRIDPATGAATHSTIHRYLTEDFAFCHRARAAGFPIMADTSIRLWRIGSYGFGWEDAGSEPERCDTFRHQVEP